MLDFKNSLKLLLKVAESIKIVEYGDYETKEDKGNLKIVISVKVKEEDIKDTIFEDRLWPCGICDYITEDKDDLKRHNHCTHSKRVVKKKHNCSFCTWSFNYRCNLIEHIRSVHDKTKRYKCPAPDSVCDQTTYKWADMVRHINRKHHNLQANPVKIETVDKNSFLSLWRKKDRIMRRCKKLHPGQYGDQSCVRKKDKNCDSKTKTDRLDEEILLILNGAKEKLELNGDLEKRRTKKARKEENEMAEIRIEEIDGQNQTPNGNETKLETNGDLREERSIKKIRKFERRIKRKWAEAGLSSKSKWKEAKRFAVDLPEAERYADQAGNLKELWKDFKEEQLVSELMNTLLNDIEIKMEPNKVDL